MADCKDCKEEVFWDYNMVMLHDTTWVRISDDWSDIICDECMVKRLGRPIVESDFKSNGIPCNEAWLKRTTGNYSKYMQNNLDNSK